MTEGINSIKLNNPSIQGSTVRSDAQKAETENEKEQSTGAVETKEVSKENYSAFINAQTSYALAGLNISANKTHNAEYYLSRLTPAQRASLEASVGAMMQEFEGNVVAFMKSFEEELGANFTNLPEDEQIALAATAFANNDEE